MCVCVCTTRVYEKIIEYVHYNNKTRDGDDDDESNRANKHRVDDRYRPHTQVDMGTYLYFVRFFSPRRRNL